MSEEELEMFVTAYIEKHHTTEDGKYDIKRSKDTISNESKDVR